MTILAQKQKGIIISMKYNQEPRSAVVDEQQLRNQSRQSNAKRHKKRHKKNYALHYIILLFLLTVTLVTLSFTVLFNIKKITVSDNKILASQTVIKNSGAKIGDNLLLVNTKQIANEVLNKNIAIDAVEVKRKFPTTLHIELKIAKTKLIIRNEKQFYYFSNAGRLIKIADTVDEPSVIQFIGINISNMKLGEYIKKSDKNHYQDCLKIYDTIAAAKMPKITGVSLENPSCITLNYNNQIQIKVGNIKDLTYKLNVAKEVIKKIGDNEKGVIDVQINGKAFFKPEVKNPNL
ncbi:FtsQ-type POTRA domain-containing protein [Paludicola sp. MB14-C6]|uniref:cell division protein FtsQ/DivIB n=1 Tax=Paludihabitans sp. MB14-C6 TaxID=3070656 RepID=UPI0027DDDD27|nr:FtsQ-type POTRA domain-containing protein [Paludicola sp. MB14-C6]WMJ23758.1 FtsQ-type POTRA domain-containing protein [Paludicola sp. MB14-C6]